MNGPDHEAQEAYCAGVRRDYIDAMTVDAQDDELDDDLDQDEE